jgi:PAS domain S-box-containing protein
VRPLQYADRFNRKQIKTAPVASLMIEEGCPRYLLANTAAQQLLGYTRDELRRMSPADIIADGQKTAMASARRSLRESGRWRDELRLRRKDGTVVLVDATASRLEVGERVVYLSLLRGITPWAQAQEAGAA